MNNERANGPDAMLDGIQRQIPERIPELRIDAEPMIESFQRCQDLFATLGGLRTLDQGTDASANGLRENDLVGDRWLDRINPFS